jgi:hypothetical protein
MFVVTAHVLVQSLVEEREMRVKSGLRAIGVDTRVVFAAWFTVYTVIFAAVSGVAAIVASIALFTNSSVVVRISCHIVSFALKFHVSFAFHRCFNRTVHHLICGIRFSSLLQSHCSSPHLWWYV